MTKAKLKRLPILVQSTAADGCVCWREIYATIEVTILDLQPDGKYKKGWTIKRSPYLKINDWGDYDLVVRLNNKWKRVFHHDGKMSIFYQGEW